MASRTVGRLTARRVATAKPRHGRDVDYLADGGNLLLQVRRYDDHITRNWIFRYELRGKRHDYGLGALHSRSLADARAKAYELRQLLVDGVDPLQERRAQEQERRAREQAQEAAEAKRVTFKQCAEQYIHAHSASWRNPEHGRQWRSTLQQYAFPVLGNLAVSDIEVAHVMRALQPVWDRIPVTASRLRGRIESVLGYATVRGFRHGDNPARWRGHLQTLLPSQRKLRPVQHHRSLDYGEVPAVVAALRTRQGVGARCLEFLILTAGRTKEVLGATWDEMDLKAKTWTVPSTRMKSGKPHRVPLSNAALAVLAGMPRHGERVFPMGETALRDLLKRRLKVDGTVHGFRAAFATWASEQTAFAHEVREQALAHVIPSAVERAYKRTDLFDRRRKLMEQWAGYLAKPAVTDATVTPLRQVL